jgi:hypothetical protein
LDSSANQPLRKHVRNDLDPYVCLFENCDEADKLYKHSEQWLSHMHQHSQRWRCSSHRELDPFPTQEEYMQHMREAHYFNLGEKKLLILANRNARKTTKLFTSCPLCGESETEEHGRLENHITGHLRSLALKSLPPYQDDMDADFGSGRGSCDGSQLRSEKATNDPSTGKNSSTYRMNNELSALSEMEDTYFMNDAPSDIDSRHMDMWNFRVKDWMSGKPTLQHLQQTSNEDPILKFMHEKVKKSQLLPSTPLQHPQQLTLSQSQQRVRAPAVEVDAENSQFFEGFFDLPPIVEDNFLVEEINAYEEQLWMHRGPNVPERLTVESNTSPTPLSNIVERDSRFNGFENLRLDPIVDYGSLHNPELKEQKPDELHTSSEEPNLSVPHGDLYFPPSDPTAQNPPCNTLYVGNLPVDVDEEELKAMFAKQRGYKRLAFRTKKNGPLCFVEFEDASFADRALHELYGQELSNSTKGGIRLSFSKNPLGVRSNQPPASQETLSRNLSGHEAVGSASKSFAPSSVIDPFYDSNWMAAVSNSQIICFMLIIKLLSQVAEMIAIDGAADDSTNLNEVFFS